MQEWLFNQIKSNISTLMISIQNVENLSKLFLKIRLATTSVILSPH